MSIYTGACLCKGITFNLTGDPQAVFVCYCTDCSLNAGGPLQITARFPSPSLQLHDPENLKTVYTVTSGTVSGHPKEKHFCGRCGCTLFTVPLKHDREIVVMRTAVIDGGLERFWPQAELFCKRRPSYLKPCEGTEEWEEMPVAK